VVEKRWKSDPGGGKESEVSRRWEEESYSGWSRGKERSVRSKGGEVMVQSRWKDLRVRSGGKEIHSRGKVTR